VLQIARPANNQALYEQLAIFPEKENKPAKITAKCSSELLSTMGTSWNRGVANLFNQLNFPYNFEDSSVPYLSRRASNGMQHPVACVNNCRTQKHKEEQDNWPSKRQLNSRAAVRVVPPRKMRGEEEWRMHVRKGGKRGREDRENVSHRCCSFCRCSLSRRTPRSCPRLSTMYLSSKAN
jgi:hypothetical protein